MTSQPETNPPQELEIRHWKEIRCFNIPVNEEMLSPQGFTRKLSCVLKNECPRHKPAKLRMVTFDRDYVVSKLNKMVSQLGGDKNLLGDLLS